MSGDEKIALGAEGPDDSRFLKWLVKPRLEQQFATVKILEYSTRVWEVNKLLQSMSNQGFKYLFTADQDASPCIGSRREKLLSRFPALDSKLQRLESS